MVYVLCFMSRNQKTRKANVFAVFFFFIINVGLGSAANRFVKNVNRSYYTPAQTTGQTNERRSVFQIGNCPRIYILYEILNIAPGYYKGIEKNIFLVHYNDGHGQLFVQLTAYTSKFFYIFTYSSLWVMNKKLTFLYILQNKGVLSLPGTVDVSFDMLAPFLISTFVAQIPKVFWFPNLKSMASFFAAMRMFTQMDIRTCLNQFQVCY